MDKFNYLRSLAYEAIAGLTLSSANYVEAIDILKKRFRDQLIILRHMETLLNTVIITSDQNVRGLRRLYDNVESHEKPEGAWSQPGGLRCDALICLRKQAAA